MPEALHTCRRVWVRTHRVIRSLEAPYSGPFEVVSRRENHFVIRYPSGREDTVSLHRLKPFIEISIKKLEPDKRIKQLVKASKEIQSDENESLVENSEDLDTETVDDNAEIENLSNVDKFKRKIPFQTRSGRTVKFAAKHQIKFIEPQGKCKPTPKR